MAEMALAMPVLIGVVALAVSGGHMIDSAVLLAGAGNAAATAASVDIASGTGNIASDAAGAANREEGIVCSSSPKCITVTTTTALGANGTSEEMLVLSQTVPPVFPGTPSMIIRSTAVVGN